LVSIYLYLINRNIKKSEGINDKITIMKEIRKLKAEIITKNYGKNGSNLKRELKCGDFMPFNMF